MRTRVATSTVQGLVRGLALARLCAMAWVTAAFAADAGDYRRGGLALVTVVALALLSGLLAVLAWTQPQRAMRPTLWGCEVVAVVTALLLDALAWPPGELFGARQSLVGALPLIAALSSALAIGPAAGVIGAGLGAARAVAALVNDSDLTGETVTSVAASVVFGAVAGTVGGWVGDRVRLAEDAAAQARAREDLVRSVHDSVLQTLAAATRSGTPEMAEMARRADTELRQVLFGPTATEAGLRAAIERASRSAGERYGHQPQVNVMTEREPRAAVTLAIAGAIGEAVNNALRHGHATTVTVFAESLDDRVTATIRDDGSGFDTDTMPSGRGLTGSIIGRVEGIGGRVRIVSSPGKGCRIDLEVPQ